MAKMLKGATSFGRLWGKGYENLSRRILSVQGSGATTYLQGLVTSHLMEAPIAPRPLPDRAIAEQPMDTTQASGSEDSPQETAEFNPDLRTTCFLNHKGRLLTDSLLWKVSEEQYYIDCPESTGEDLLQHLKAHKLRRSKVDIRERSDMSAHVVFGTLAGGSGSPSPPGYLAGLDPRHPSLGLRVLKLPEDDADQKEDGGNNDSSNEPPKSRTPEFGKLMSSVFPESPGNYDLVRRLAGVPEGEEVAQRVALECNFEHLNAISFSKGCYLGQELTARVHHTGALRKRIMPILLFDVTTEVPQAWSLASSLQEGRAKKRFTREEILKLPPTRLPQLSVWTAGNFVAIATGSAVDPAEDIEDAARAELDRVQARAAELLDAIDTSCQAGAKMFDEDGKTIGQVVGPPLPGTNVVLALMRLDAVGLSSGSVWSKTNKITIGDGKKPLRYLPYMPLWWPDLDPATGKGRAEGDDGVDESEVCADGGSNGFRLPKIEFETVPLTSDVSAEEGSQDKR